MIRFASQKDYAFLGKNDSHITDNEIKSLLNDSRYLIYEINEDIIGWLRWGLFWDNTPFMNMLYFLDGYRGKGYGRQLVSFWECEMKNRGYKTLMTSSQADEQAQHFYRKLGYRDSGSLLFPNEPLEIFFIKQI